MIVSGVTPRNRAAQASAPSSRYQTVAQLASTDYFNENVVYDEVIVTVGDNGDYIFKTGATETVISKDNRIATTVYQAKAGESVNTVAADFGISPDTLKYVNKISSNTLTSGQSLKIPPADGLYITVAKNDTLLGIANKYKVQLPEIRKYNDLPEGAPIFAGQEIFIPGVVVPKPTVAVPAKTGSGGNSHPSIVGAPQFLPKGGQFIWPTSSPTHFISQGYYSYHRALDLNRLNGYDLHASAAGVVTALPGSTGYGNHIIIDHGDGYTTLYGHMSQFLVKTGDYVQQGQLIGIMGSTGHSTGPHVHFEIRYHDVPQNPLNYLPH